MAKKKSRRPGNRQSVHRDRDNDYPSVLNRAALGGLRVAPGAGVEKLVENIAGCIDKKVISAAFGGVPTSTKGINKAIRESVLEGLAAADVHRTWLAELDRIARNAEDLSALKRAISAYVRQAGIECVEDPERASLYRVVDGVKDGAKEVVNPAYVDGINGRLILSGHLRYGAEKDRPAAMPETTEASSESAK